MTDVPQHLNSIIEILLRKTLLGVEVGVWNG
jgi:Trm5-related predicted tRNA methylase